MSEGSLIAGFGFGNASCAAVHALAYPLGSRFHVPHGVANGLLLPYVMEVNLPACLDKYTVIAGKLGVDTSGLSPQEASAKGIEAARKLAADIVMPVRLRELGVPRDALEGMAVATMDVTRLLACNPKQLSLDDVRRIWQNAW